MTPQSSFRSHWMRRTATRMSTFLLLAVILQNLIGNVVRNTAAGAYVIHSDEGNYSIFYNGSHFFYDGDYDDGSHIFSDGDYYDENSTYLLDYSAYETPVPEIFGNSASHLLQGLLPFFFSLFHLVHFLLQDIRL